MKEEKYKTFEELKEELGDKYDRFMYDMNLELVKQKCKAIDYAKNCLENLKDQNSYACESIDIVALLRMVHNNYIDYLEGDNNDK